MHDGMPYGRNQGQGQGHSREVDRQSPTGLIFCCCFAAQRKHEVERIRQQFPNKIPVCNFILHANSLAMSGQLISRSS